MIRVSEIFYSLQGEGKYMGVPAVFLRLSNCNLLCGGKGTDKDGKLHGATWRCDTIEQWKQGKNYTIEELYQEFAKQGYLLQLKKGAHLIITGGEPLLQQKELAKFLTYLNQPIFIEIETNGTIYPEIELHLWINQYNVSPKLSNSGVLKKNRYKIDVLEKISKWKRCIFKFVISKKEDIDEINNSFIYKFHINPKQVYLMPASSTRDKLNNCSVLVADMCKKHGYNFSSRLQLQIWDKTVGV